MADGTDTLSPKLKDQVWVWCRECERCHREGWLWDGSSSECPYWDCGSEDAQSLAWEWMRRLQPNFPIEPSLGARYHADGWLWCEVCERCWQFSTGGEHCPYADCRDEGEKRAWPWWRVKAGHKEYPEVPERGERSEREEVKQVAKGAEPGIVAYRRVKVAENVFKKTEDVPKAWEVACMNETCRTINPKRKERCLNCHQGLPGHEGYATVFLCFLPYLLKVFSK